MTHQLELRPIADLLDEQFFVPSYQRGYRWTRREVTQLLDDIDAFQQSAARGSYYCLQPVVVRRREDGRLDLVDGQQRLTTLFLILQRAERVGSYSIEYATRPGSAGFLADPDPDRASQNIDFHHMAAAREVIDAWFAERGREWADVDVLKCITQPSARGPNVRVIWYELDPDQDPVAVFVRLNVGRIPLTSAELIRALLLRSDREAAPAEHERTQIAQEWDAVEKRLQDPAFWFFLSNDGEAPPARIEFVFDLFVRSETSHRVAPTDPLATFLGFQQHLEQGGERVRDTWLDVKRIALLLEEWFEDRDLFHLVGYLVATARSGPATLVELLRARTGSTASEFDRELRRRAWRRIGGKLEELASAEALAAALDSRILGYQYGNRDRVRSVLLLFNVAGLLANTESNQRFRFDGFKTMTWDIEHIRSVAEYVPDAAAGRRHWLEEARDFVRHTPGQDALEARIDDELGKRAPDEHAFDAIFDAVRALSGEADAREDDDGLSNLTLLDMSTNRSYRNAVFPVKRRRIIQLDRDGTFVPPSTRNVFLKYYSPHASQLLVWDAEDQAAYAAGLRATLLDFFAPLVATGEDA